jgi:hypothetical protein
METKTILLNKVSMDLYQKIRKLAFEEENSVSGQVIAILKEYFNHLDEN